MSENKKITINISTFFLIIAIIVIIVMGIFMYKMYNELNTSKETGNISESDYERQLSSLQEEINELKSEKVNTVDNNSTTNTSIVTESNNDDEPEFSDSEVKEAAQKYIDLSNSIYADTTSVFETLGFEPIDDVGGWIETDVKYSSFKKRMLEYMTENCFEENFSKIYKERNDNVYFLFGASTGEEEIVTNVKNIEDNTYIITTEIIHDDESSDILTAEITVANSEGKCVIDSIISK